MVGGGRRWSEVVGLEGPTGTIDLGKNLGKHLGFYNILLIFDHGGTIEDYRFGEKSGRRIDFL